MNLLENLEPEEELVAAAVEKSRIKAAMDSAAVDNVIGPDDLPAGVEPSGNTSGKHFVGANGSHIRKYGTCDLLMEGEFGEFGCRWQVADVTRPLNSVSKVTGPQEHPTGKQDVLFNNKRCVVVAPGVVEWIMKHIDAVAEYKREGGLYLADLVMSGFPRPGAGQ